MIMSVSEGFDAPKSVTCRQMIMDGTGNVAGNAFWRPACPGSWPRNPCQAVAIMEYVAGGTTWDVA
jgi:hypothetical protein